MRSSRITAIIAAIIMACSALLFVTTSSPATANHGVVGSEATFKIVNHNLGSGVESDKNGDGVYAGNGSIEDPITRVVNRIQAENPHAVTLQEVCSGDVPRMLSQLGGSWTSSIFAQMSGPSTQFGGNSCQQTNKPGASTNAKGNVILTRVGIVNGTEQSVQPLLTDKNNRTISLLCANVNFGPGRHQVCTTHLTAGAASDTVAVQQRNDAAERIRVYVEGEEVNVPMVLAGDFNSNPKTFAIDKFHAVNRSDSAFTTARFYEGDHESNATGGLCASSFKFCRVGESTNGVNGGSPQKIDYVFWGRHFTKFAASPDLYVRSSDTSGHEVITSSNLVRW